jgi:hypothetical protein
VQNCRRVDTAAEPYAERHIGHEMLANRLFQEPIKLRFRILEGHWRRHHLRHLPVSLLVDATVLPLKPKAWRQFLNAFDQRPRRRDVVHGQKAIQTFQAELPLYLWMNQNAFQFGREEEVLSSFGYVKRLDSYAITGEHQPLPGVTPYGGSEHAAQAGETVCVPFKKRVEHSFGVAMRLEAVTARLECLANFEVVINLSVEDDRGVAILRVDRLIAPRQVDDLETCCTERAALRLVKTLLIRSAMQQGVGRLPDALRTGRPRFSCESDYAAQFALAFIEVDGFSEKDFKFIMTVHDSVALRAHNGALTMVAQKSTTGSVTFEASSDAHQRSISRLQYEPIQ